ncbi:MAG: hypothetical protein J0I17_13335 ['Candidatus Kapabacteria' thiocyanatum]|uniref:Uncharacterized protein n=1 Tax=Candidatus Kapaibacterium thiocyanatum TaxID=1895771 RepID=A0A1M3KZG2_9BACT|nr:hypothetical protein ['Candidatus Kapabacteria' thiocyanatum]OJX57943.1 MAG: hypothetical protein BGO89_05950 ['Candidatus Kapabacteria' thiocyanatum]
MDREVFRQLRALNAWQVPAWIIGSCLYVSKVVLLTCVSKGNVLGNAVGAFVLVAAITMDNTRRKETVVELVKAMQQDVPSLVAWGLAILFGLLWFNRRASAGKERPG